MVIDMLSTTHSFCRNFAIYNFILNSFYKITGKVYSSLRANPVTKKATMSIEEEIDEISDMIKKIT